MRLFWQDPTVSQGARTLFLGGLLCSFTGKPQNAGTDSAGDPGTKARLF